MFEDVSHLLPRLPPALHYGAAVVEPWGDGRRALAVAGFLGPNRLLAWERGQLVDLADDAFADPARQAIGLCGADADGDGREEIYVVNTDRHSGPKRLSDRWFDFADGLFQDLFELPQNTESQNLFAGRSVGAVDRRGDGRYSFLVANHGGPLKLYRQGSGEDLVDLAPTLGLARITQARSVFTGPLVSGRGDLLVGTEGGPNLLFRAMENGRYREVAERAGLCDPRGNSRGIAAFDDGPGRLGLVLAGWQTPNRSLAPLLPGVLFSDRTPAPLAAPGRVRTAIVADFDNDGFEELFLNLMGEPNRLFRRREGQWHELSAGAARLPSGLGTGAAVADVDGDGNLELLICHGEEEPQPLSLLRVARPGPRSVRIAPRTRQGAPARGALVQLFTDQGVRTRLVCAGSGYLCEQEPVAHFGLRQGEEPKSALVRWPSGAEALVLSPAVGVEHAVLYPHPTGG